MVTDIDILKKELSIKLGEEKYIHSIGVMNMCEKLAKIYNVDILRAKLIGLMHDYAKEMPKDEKIKYIEKNNLSCSNIEKKVVDLLHGKIAGDLCKKKFKFDDEMCEAIDIHTTGKENMTILQKILFIADKIEENRDYEGVESLRKLAYINIDKAILQNLDNTIVININKNKLILEQSIKTRNYLLISSEK